MKKVLLALTLLLLIVALAACGNTDKTTAETTTAELTTQAALYTILDGQALPPDPDQASIAFSIIPSNNREAHQVIIRSHEELLAWAEAIDTSATEHPAFQAYDAAFFEKNSLAVITFSESSGSRSHRAADYTVNEGKLTLDIEIYSLGIETMDMKYWHMFAEFSQTALADCTDIECRYFSPKPEQTTFSDMLKALPPQAVELFFSHDALSAFLSRYAKEETALDENRIKNILTRYPETYFESSALAVYTFKEADLFSRSITSYVAREDSMALKITSFESSTPSAQGLLSVIFFPVSLADAEACRKIYLTYEYGADYNICLPVTPERSEGMTKIIRSREELDAYYCNNPVTENDDTILTNYYFQKREDTFFETKALVLLCLEEPVLKTFLKAQIFTVSGDTVTLFVTRHPYGYAPSETTHRELWVVIDQATLKNVSKVAYTVTNRNGTN